MFFLITAMWQNDIYKYIFSNILFHYGLSQNIEYSSLCCTVGPCCLSILYIIVASTNAKLFHPPPTSPSPPPRPWQPPACSL